MGAKSPRHAQQDSAKLTAILCVALYVYMTIPGCGYTIATTPLSKDYRTIAAPAFKNDTNEEDLQVVFNNILIGQLESDGRLRIVNDPTDADLVLKGTIAHFDPRAISYVTSKDRIAQFQITIAASATLEDTRTGKVLWRNSNIRGTDFYQTQGGHTREQAIQEATERLVERLIYEMLDTYW